MEDTNTPQTSAKDSKKVTVTDKNFDGFVEKLREVLKVKVEGNWITELQARQILENFETTREYEDVKQYLEE